MEERGKAYSQQAIAMRINISTDTLRMKLRGKRKIYSFELERIAEALHVSVERLMQSDTSELEQELDLIFSALQDPEQSKSVAQKLFWSEATSDAFAENQYADLMKQRALTIAEQLTQCALGVSEKSKSFNQLGRAYYYLHRYQEAHDAWLLAYGHAKKLADKTISEKEPLFNVITNLMISYSNRKEYSELSKILNDIESFFISDPKRKGIINYSLAKISEQKGETEKASQYYYASLNAYRETEAPFFISKALHNTACFEFRCGNFATSKDLFEQALPDLSDHTFHRFVCTKEYCKTLISLGENKHAAELIASSLRKIGSKEMQHLHDQFTLMLSLANDNPEHAEQLLDRECDPGIKQLAYRLLMDLYDKRGDSYSLMKYYRMAKDIGFSSHNILFEEDL